MSGNIYIYMSGYKFYTFLPIFSVCFPYTYIFAHIFCNVFHIFCMFSIYVRIYIDVRNFRKFPFSCASENFFRPRKIVSSQLSRSDCVHSEALLVVKWGCKIRGKDGKREPEGAGASTVSRRIRWICFSTRLNFD